MGTICHLCNKKLPLLQFKCKCDNYFCIKDRLPEVHNCTYDYKTPGIEKLRKDNPVIQSSKITHI